MAKYIVRGDKVSVYRGSRKAPKNALIVGSAADIAASDLSMARLVALWNALPGATPLNKFKDPATAARRLWFALEHLPYSHMPKARQPRANSKQALVVAMLRRNSGATVSEVAKGMGWQAHTVRGLISGALKKRLGLQIASTKERRGRAYRIVADTKLAV